MSSILGVYDHLVLPLDKGLIAGVLDRRHGKERVEIREHPLEDLRTPPRDRTSVKMVGPVGRLDPDSARSVELPDRTLLTIGSEQTSFSMGFGRRLACAPVEAGEGSARALVTIGLPADARFRLDFPTAVANGGRLSLGDGVRVEVVSAHPWSMDGTTLTVVTGREGVDLYLLVESTSTTLRVADQVIFAPADAWAEVLTARSRLSGGWVPLLDASAPSALDTLDALLRTSRVDRIVTDAVLPHISEPTVPLTSIAASAETPTLLVPDDPRFAGPALFLALRHGASVDVRAGLDAMEFRGRRVTLDDVVGAVQEGLEPNPDELVVAECSTHGFIALAAADYAHAKGLPVLFLHEFDPLPNLDSLDDPAEPFRQLADRAVPASQRTPSVARMTVFTAAAPLHLTPVPGGGRWGRRYEMAHLPGHAAALLLARSGSDDAEAGRDHFHLIFDALGESEADAVHEELERGLAVPLLLAGASASAPALREISCGLGLASMHIAAHGQDDYLEDSRGDRIRAEDIRGWRLTQPTVVFNNSCSSLSTTGQAWLEAGAGAVIGTLWPVDHQRAATLGAETMRRLADGEFVGRLGALHATLRDLADPAHDDTDSSYVFVGLHTSRSDFASSASVDEPVVLLTRALLRIYDVMGAAARDGRPYVAIPIASRLAGSIHRRLATFLKPGELPHPLAPPMAQFTLLELPMVRAILDLRLGIENAWQLSGPDRDEHVHGLDQMLGFVVGQLTEWDERHAAHLGESQPRPPSHPFFSNQALGDMGFVRVGSQLAVDLMLPFAALAASSNQRDRAEFWWSMAAKVVTTRNDVGADGQVSDAALLARIRDGFPMPVRTMWSRDGGDGPESTDLLAGAVSKSRLANQFGRVRERLGQSEAAVPFFELAASLAEPGSNDRLNAESNSATAGAKAADGAASDPRRATMYAQAEGGDFRNALTTLLNLAQDLDAVTPEDLAHGPTWLAAVEPATEQFALRCRWLGTLAVRSARQGDHGAAAEWQGKALELLLEEEGPQDAVMTALAQLIVHYRDSGDSRRERRLSERAARALDERGLRRPAAIFVAQTMAGLTAAGGLTVSQAHRVVETAEWMTRLIAGDEALREELEEALSDTVENLRRAWKGPGSSAPRLSIRAYSALTRLDPEARDDAWEALALTEHRVNRGAVLESARAGELTRHGTVDIDRRWIPRIRLETRRRPSRSGGRRFERLWIRHRILGEHPPPRSRDDLWIAGGQACFELTDDGSRAVEQLARTPLDPVDGRVRIYQSLWGSSTIAHTLEVRLPPGVVPLDVHTQALSLGFAERLLRWEGGRWTVRLAPARGRPWFAQTAVVMLEAPDLSERLLAPGSLFRDWRPYEELEQRLGRGDESRRRRPRFGTTWAAVVQANEHASAGVEALQSGDHERALTELTRACELDPGHTGHRCMKGFAHEELRQDNEADRCFNEVLERDPDNPGALLGQAKLAAAYGNVEVALARFDRLLSVHPDSPLGHFHRGSVLMKAHRWDEAADALSRSVEAGYPDAERALRLCRMMQQVQGG